MRAVLSLVIMCITAVDSTTRQLTTDLCATADWQTATAISRQWQQKIRLQAAHLVGQTEFGGTDGASSCTVTGFSVAGGSASILSGGGDI